MRNSSVVRRALLAAILLTVVLPGAASAATDTDRSVQHTRARGPVF